MLNTETTSVRPSKGSLWGNVTVMPPTWERVIVSETGCAYASPGSVASMRSARLVRTGARREIMAAPPLERDYTTTPNRGARQVQCQSPEVWDVARMQGRVLDAL